MAVPVARGGGGLKKVLVILGVVVAGIIAIAIIGGLALTQGPRDAVDRHLALFAAGDFAGAYRDAAPALRSAVTAADYERIVRANPVLLRGTYTWSSATVTGDEAVVEGVGTGANGAKANLEFHLAKVGETWRVMGVGVKPIP